MIQCVRNRNFQKEADMEMSPEVTLAVFAHDIGLFEHYGSYFDLLRNEDGTKKSLEPISDFRQALVLLYPRRNDRTERCLEVRGDFIDDRHCSAIVIREFSGGYGKDELSGTHRFEVLPDVVARLKDARILSGTPHMGFTDENELRLNDRAAKFIIEEAERFMEEKAVRA